MTSSIPAVSYTHLDVYKRQGHFLDSLFAVQLDCGIMGDLVEIVMVVDDRAGEGIILQFCLGTERGGGILTDPAQQRLDLAAHLSGMGAAGTRCV